MYFAKVSERLVLNESTIEDRMLYAVKRTSVLIDLISLGTYFISPRYLLVLKGISSQSFRQVFRDLY